MGETQTCDITLHFSAVDDTDDSELDRLARRLNLELRQEDIDSILAPGSVVPGTRSAVGAALGTLVVKITPALIPLLIDRTRKFLARSNNRTVKVKVRMGKNAVDIEFPSETSVSTKEVAELVKKLSSSVDS